MSIAEDIKARRFTIDADEFAFVLATTKVQKHQAGKHDQKTHAGGRGGGIESWSKENDLDYKYVERVYSETYDMNTYDEANTGNNDVANAVQYYVEDGYVSMNGLARGKNVDPATTELATANSIANLDKAITESPDIIGDKNLYRVYSNKVLENIEQGDVLVDKGFLSTTRIDITDTNVSSRTVREKLGMISRSDDTIAVILPSPQKKGQGLIVDDWLSANGRPFQRDFEQREFEVILPRNTSVTFLGFRAEQPPEYLGGAIREKVAIFQRND